MAIEANLHGEGCRLTLRGERYEPSGLSTGDDGNWVSGEVELKVGLLGSFRARLRVSLRTFELVSFRDSLRDLDLEQTGEAELTHVEEQFGANVRLWADQGSISGFVREHVGAELRYDVATDAASIAKALTEFDALVRAFPIRD